MWRGLLDVGVHHLGDPDPQRRVKPFRDTRGPGEEAVAKMFETLGKSDSPKARRDQAILRLLFDLGLRRESIVSLHLQLVPKLGAIRMIVVEGFKPET